MSRIFEGKTNTVIYHGSLDSELPQFKQDVADKRNIRISQTNIRNYYFEDCNIKKVTIENCNGHLTIKRSTIDELTINSPKIDFLLLENEDVKIEKLILMNFGLTSFEMPKLEIKNFVFNSSLNSEIILIVNDNPTINNIDIINFRSVKRIQISNLDNIEKILLKSNIRENKKPNCENLIIKNLQSASSIEIENLYIDKMILEESNFKNTILKTVNFEVNEIEYDYIFNWFKSIINSKDQESLIGYQKFKTTTKNQADHISEQYFRAKEFELRRKNLKPKLKVWERDFWEKILLTLNYISNYHGTRWYQAAIISILFTTTCYWLYVKTLNIAMTKGFPIKDIFIFYLPTHSASVKIC